MRSFRGKVAAITGAGSGIGRALAEALAAEGCELALSDVNEAGLADTVQRASARGVRVTSERVDVRSREGLHAWAGRVVHEHGRVNLLFNNAGVALSGTVKELAVEDYAWIMDINFWGVVVGTKAFLPHLEASGDGHVVNLSSIFGLTAQPLMSGYNASKYAVRGFTESLRQELELTGSCVSATCVHPGGIKTNIAKAARVSSSVAAVTGMDEGAATREFERTFITTPERAAATILAAVRKNARRVLVGPDAHLYDLLVRTAPAAYQRVVTGVIKWRSKG